MVRKRNNQLAENLPQLQNLIKRDPASYKDEFLRQQRHYKSMLNVFAMNPSEFNKGLAELSMFMAQVSHCYTDMLTSFAEQLINVLETHNTVLESNMRMTFCKALILLRNKGLLKPMDLLALFFGLLRCQDKVLRTFLQEHIINDIKNINVKHKDIKLNKNLQNFMYIMLKDNNAKAAKMSVNIMIDLYNKNIWNDTKTANVISAACFSKVTKVMVTALKFFATDASTKKNADDESESSSDDNTPNAMEVMMANKFNKKTRKRGKTLKKVQKIVEKTKKRKKKICGNYNAIYLIHDPQDFAEKLLKQLQKRHERFEVKILTLDVISRLIGIHQLILFNFYPYIQRFLQPHQKEVTKLLLFIAQATHELVPPDVMEPVLKTLANNFVTERNSSDVMAVGLNAIRETCARSPLIMTEDLLWDLAQYKHYKERSVSMAAQSLIHVYRNSLPKLLPRKERGRPTEATVELKVRQYGETDAKEFIPGAEIILEQNENEVDQNESDESDGGEWVDVDHSSDEESDVDDEESKSDCENDEESIDDNVDIGATEVSSSDKNDAYVDSNILNTEKTKPQDTSKQSQVVTKSEIVAQRKELATEVSVTRILTDDDFKRIEAAQIKKQVTSAKNRKRLAEPETDSKGELVYLADIENIHKKRRHDKEARLETVMRGREGREKFGYKDRRQNPHCSRTNRERKKKKNFMMIKHKVKAKVKRSFKDKQITLRNHLIKLSKMSNK